MASLTSGKIRSLNSRERGTEFVCVPLFQGSLYPGEGLTNQTLYWSVSDDLGSTWSPPTNPLPPMTNGLPVWSPVLHVEVGPHLQPPKTFQL